MSEQHRHRCETRWCITQGAAWFTEYIKGVAKARGKEAAQQLLRDVKQQHQLGNTGSPGDWREEQRIAA